MTHMRIAQENAELRSLKPYTMNSRRKTMGLLLCVATPTMLVAAARDNHYSFANC